MAKSSNQKLKLMYLARILMDETDEDHGLSMPDIISRLAALDIAADRKTLYSDFEELRKFGMDIIGEKDGKSYLYRLTSRDFELAELKLLVDSVQAAKFITEKKSRALIKKLEGLVSVHEAKQLQRQVLMAGRVKTMNESIYYNVDKLHAAIHNNSRIRFQYFQWDVDKKQKLRHDGAWYHVSPWHLIWDDEYYYLVAYDERSGQLKHYRVDKMLRITLTREARAGGELVAGSDAVAYSKSLFGMFSGRRTNVTLEAENDLAGVLIDRFGKELPIMKLDDARFRTRVEVVPSSIFLGWVMSFGGRIKLTAPDSVVDDMKRLIRTMGTVYGE